MRVRNVVVFEGVRSRGFGAFGASPVTGQTCDSGCGASNQDCVNKWCDCQLPAQYVPDLNQKCKGWVTPFTPGPWSVVGATLRGIPNGDALASLAQNIAGLASGAVSVATGGLIRLPTTSPTIDAAALQRAQADQAAAAAQQASMIPSTVLGIPTGKALLAAAAIGAGLYFSKSGGFHGYKKRRK